mmetsp:Transcript_149229/g.275396  ORF Transcript_149229/g.275396 Transcript_149229/m.275396 type:complete len:96 (-) Transcript_149229:305-592(-)
MYCRRSASIAERRSTSSRLAADAGPPVASAPAPVAGLRSEEQRRRAVLDLGFEAAERLPQRLPRSELPRCAAGGPSAEVQRPRLGGAEDTALAHG